MEQSKNNKIIAGAIVIAAVVLIAVAASMFNKPEESTSQNHVTSQNPEDIAENVSNTTTDASNEYKDGVYKVSDTYSSPGGIEDIKVTLTLFKNTITEVNVAQEANNNESAAYQKSFQQSYKSKVVGKALSSLQLTRSSGASLTTNAFNEALDEIRKQAKV